MFRSMFLGGGAEARMAKDVKVVRNIKTSVTSFWDTRANGKELMQELAYGV